MLHLTPPEPAPTFPGPATHSHPVPPQEFLSLTSSAGTLPIHYPGDPESSLSPLPALLILLTVTTFLLGPCAPGKHEFESLQRCTEKAVSPFTDRQQRLQEGVAHSQSRKHTGGSHSPPLLFASTLPCAGCRAAFWQTPRSWKLKPCRGARSEGAARPWEPVQWGQPLVSPRWQLGGGGGGPCPRHLPLPSSFTHKLLFTIVPDPHQKFPVPFFGLGTLHRRQSLTFYN